MKRIGLVLIVGLALLVGAFLLGPRVDVGPPEDYPPPPALDGIERWLSDREAALGDVTPGNEARVVWADAAAPSRKPWAIIQFHGFSAGPAETTPFGETVARALGGNLYKPRLRGHGRPGEALAEATVEQWFADALQALEVGRRLGERVLLVGTSTGGSLAIWLAARPEAAGVVDALVLISPNLGVPDPRGRMLTGPWGRQLAEAIIGEYREWTPENDMRRRFWTWRYPTRALLPMMALVDQVEALPADAVAARTLVYYSPHDPTLDVDAIARWSAADPRRTVVVVGDDIPDGNHVLVGDITAPARTARIAAQTVAFARGEPIEEPAR